MATTKEVNRFSTSYWIKIVIGIIIMMVLGNVISPWSTLTKTGVQQLFIFIGMIYMIGVTNDTIFPCFLGAVAMILNGYISGADLFAKLFANATVVQLVLFFGFGVLLGQTGAAEQIAKKIITMKIVQGRPRAFLVSILMTVFICGIFINGAPAILFFFPVWDSIRDTLGYDRKSDLNKFMLVGIYASVCIGYFILPYKGMILNYISYFVGILGPYGYKFNDLYWILLQIVSYFVISIIYVFAFCAMSKKSVDMTALKNFRADQLEGFDKASRKMTYTQKVIIGAFALCMIYSFSLSLGFGANWPAYTSLTLNGFTILVLALLAILPDKTTGKPFVKLDKMFKDGVMWGMIFLLAVFLICGNSIGDASLGITGWLSEIFGGIFSNLSWPVFLLLSTFAALLLTQFLSNFTSAMIIMAITLPFAVKFMEAGLEMTTLCIGINRSAMFGYMTYSAFMLAPLLLGREEMSTKWIFTKGWVMFIAYMIGTTVVCTLFAYIL